MKRKISAALAHGHGNSGRRNIAESTGDSLDCLACRRYVTRAEMNEKI